MTADVSPASPLLGLEPRHRIPNEKRRQPSCRRSHLIDTPVCKLLEAVGVQSAVRAGICSLTRLFFHVMSSRSGIQRWGQLGELINIKAMGGHSGGARPGR